MVAPWVARGQGSYFLSAISRIEFFTYTQEALSAMVAQRRESTICNKLLKLSDENGEEEEPLTSMSSPDNLYISFIHAMNLLIKSEFQELIM